MKIGDRVKYVGTKNIHSLHNAEGKILEKWNLRWFVKWDHEHNADDARSYLESDLELLKE